MTAPKNCLCAAVRWARLALRHLRHGDTSAAVHALCEAWRERSFGAALFLLYDDADRADRDRFRRRDDRVRDTLDRVGDAVRDRVRRLEHRQATEDVARGAFDGHARGCDECRSAFTADECCPDGRVLWAADLRQWERVAHA